MEKEINDIYQKYMVAIEKNQHKYDKITKKFLNFKGLFEIVRSPVYGYQAQDVQLHDFPTDEFILSMTITQIQAFRLTQIIFSLNEKGSVASLQFKFGEQLSPKYGEKLGEEETVEFGEDRPIGEIKISHGQYHIGKISIYDKKGKRIVLIGRGPFKTTTGIKFDEDNVWVGVNVKAEKGDFFRALGIKTAKFE